MRRHREPWAEKRSGTLPIQPVEKGIKDNQNSKCMLAHMIGPLMRSAACSKW